MLLENQLIKVKWSSKNKKYYTNKGFVFTKFNDEFLVKVEDLNPNSSIKIKVICDYCGKEYEILYQHYVRSMKTSSKNACQKCSGIKVAEQTLKRRREKYYKNVVEFCSKKGYFLLTSKEDIKNLDSNITYICPIHGEYTTKLENVLAGHSCYKCGRQTALIKKNQKDIEDRRKNLFSKALAVCEEKGYIFNSTKEEIKNNTSIIKYICPYHGEKKARISNFIQGKGCPDCAKDNNRISFQLSFDEVEQRIESLGGTLINKEEYVNIAEKNLKIICPECGEVFITSLRNFTQHGGQVCENCLGSESNGERKIRYFLENNNIQFEQEKRFHDCRDINPLPFDFYLPESQTVLEYDGKQHYVDNGYFSYSLAETQKHDKIKNKYCNDNDINLIRIPYWDYYNIEKILNDKIISHEDIV